MYNIDIIYQNISKNIKNNITFIGIDGLGGSGKSTLSNELNQKFGDQHYNTLVLHLDDFINTCDVRYNPLYADWECYYNLQWRYDYFLTIIKKIQSNISTISIEIYNKETDTYFIQSHTIYERMVIIIEGIFLQRIEFKNIFDYVIYVDISENVRLNRVLERDTYIGNKNQIIDKYNLRYFPAERRYVELYKPDLSADYILRDY